MFSRPMSCVVVLFLSLVLAPLLSAEEAAAPVYSPEVEKRLDELRAKGEPVTLDDLAREPIPPEENAATIYRQAFEAYVEPNEEVEEVQRKDFEDWTAEDLAAVRAWVEENQRAIALARQAAELDKCQFVTERTGLEQPLPHLRALQHLSWLLGGSIHIHLSEGKPEAALEECLVSLRLAEHVGTGSFIDHLVEVATVSYASEHLRQVLASAGTEGLNFRPIMEAVERLLKIENLPDALKGERVMHFHALNNPETIGLTEEHVDALKSEAGSRVWMESERAALLGVFDRALSLSEKPWHQMQGEREGLDAWVEELAEKTPPCPLAMLCSGAVLHALRQPSARRTYLLHMALGIELEMHRRRTESYPESLDDLTLTYLKKPPVDPFTGLPLLYKQEGEGYLLYSAGENGVDNGGAQEGRTFKHIQDPETGEWEYREAPRADDIAWSVSPPVRRGERQAPSGPQEESQVGAPKAQGEPVTLEGGALEAIPPEEDAATIYRQAFAAYVEPDRKVMELQAKHLEDRTREDVAVVRTWVQQNELAIARANQAAAMEKCQFLQRYTGVEYQYPHLRALGQLSVLLADSVWLHVQEGEPEAAFETCLVHLRMAEQLGQGDTLAEYLLEGVLIDGARSSLQQVLDCAGVEHLDLKPLAASVRRLGDADRLIEALRHERTVKWKWLDHHMDHFDEWKDGYLEATMAHRSSRTWVQREWRALAGLFVRIISLGDEPYYETAEQREELAAQLDLYNAQNLPLTAGLLPTMTRALSVRAHRQANLGQMAFGIELEMHRRATGSYPDGLDGLKLTHLDELPVDPFSGDAFHYVKGEQGYLLYSVGPNGKDDGGEPRTPGAQGPDDIAWSVSRAGE